MKDRVPRRRPGLPGRVRRLRGTVVGLVAGLLLGLAWMPSVVAPAPATSALTASIEAAPRNGSAPLTVVFQGTAFGGSGDYVAYLWTFGDGGVGRGPSVQHTFNGSGSFPVHLSVWDSTNASAVATVSIAVGPSVPVAPPTPLGGSSAVQLEIASTAAAVFALAVLVIVLRGRSREDRVVAPRTSARPPEGTPTSSSTGASNDLERRAGPADPRPGTPPRAAVLREVPTFPAGAVAPVVAARRVLAQRLLLELGTAPRDWESASAPAVSTQAGLAARLGVQRSGVSKVLRHLEAAGIVRSEIGHAEGASRRVRVYRLTDRGERAARAIRLATGPGPGTAQGSGSPGVSRGLPAPERHGE